MSYKETLEDKLEELNFSISQIEDEKRRVEGKLNAIRVNKNIQELGISIDNIECDDDDDKPFFLVATELRDWMIENNETKPFYTWCGGVYLTKNLMDGKMGKRLCHIDDIVKQ